MAYPSWTRLHSVRVIVHQSNRQSNRPVPRLGDKSEVPTNRSRCLSLQSGPSKNPFNFYRSRMGHVDVTAKRPKTRIQSWCFTAAATCSQNEDARQSN
jgi:hypothetical protein